MPKYRLKPGQPSIEIADGQYAGRKFVIGQLYSEIPEKEARRFIKVDPQPATVKTPVKDKSTDKPQENKGAK
jgi:hypothetical protein